MDAIQEIYTTYRALTEFGIELVDELTDVQISCIYPKHGIDANPSSRFYGGSGAKSRFYCFKCKDKPARGVQVFAQFRGLTFMEALSQLERRFNVEVPKLSGDTFIDKPRDRVRPVSERVEFLEAKLIRSRDKIPLTDLVKFFRGIDAVNWDVEREGKDESMMHEFLDKIDSRVNELLSLYNSLDIP